MKIVQVVCSRGRTGFFFDDQAAIKQDAVADGSLYIGEPKTPGFTAVRQAGEAVSVMLVLEGGLIGFGDCAAVQYSGAGGRDPLFLADAFIPLIEKYVAPCLIGREADNFRALAQEIDQMEIDGKRLHTAIRYGVSQAILDAVAKAQGLNMCDVVAREYGLSVSDTKTPIFSQSGDDRYSNVDKMIMKCADVLPHGLFNSLSKTGKKGEKLAGYISWLRERILTYRPFEEYTPILHIDVYGTIGLIFGNDHYSEMAAYLSELAKRARPFTLRIEGPMDSGSRERQMTDMRGLRKAVDDMGAQVELVADEWCNTYEDVAYFADNRAGHMIQIKTPDLGSVHNTIEAVLYCKKMGMGAYQGGTCNETDRSAQVCSQISLATQPAQILAKPGMGVDEGYMIVMNEMQRTLALRRAGIGVFRR